MICPSCQKSQPMTYRCRHCGAELLRGRSRSGGSARSALPRRDVSAGGPPGALQAAPAMAAGGELALPNPYAAPQAVARAPYGSPASHVLASRGARLAAALIDTFAVFALLVPVFVGLGLSSPESATGGAGTAVTLVALIAFGAFAIYQIRLLIRHGQTLGKKIMNIRIVDYHAGSVPPASKVFLLRYVVNSLLGNIPFYSFVDVLFIFGGEQRCIHDYIAGTKVVEA